jgi:hypothetical protein
MPSVKCPGCGERVKVREGAEKLRCRECGKSFRAPDEDDEPDEAEEDSPRRGIGRRAKKSNGMKVAVIGVGGVLALAVVALVVVLIVRGGKGGSGAPVDQAKVTAENFRSVKPGMDLAEVEKILGGSRSSSEDDMRDAFRKTGDGLKGEIAAAWEVGWARFGEGTEWRRWDGKNFRAWVVFAETKEGKRAAFSTSLEQVPGGYRRVDGFATRGDELGHDLDELNAERKKEGAVRNDPKWVRGPQARALVAGEWRDGNADGLTFAADGTLKEDNAITMLDEKKSTYRVVDDKKLEITRPNLFAPPPGHPAPKGINTDPIATRYEYFVNQEEMALIRSGPEGHFAGFALHTYYRMPAKPGSAADAKLVQPLVADIQGTDATKRQIALYKLKSLGWGAPSALPALTELARGGDEQAALAAIAAIGEMRENAAPALPELTAQLKNNPSLNRGLAVIFALGKIGPAAKDALPELREFVRATREPRFKQEGEAVIRGIEGRTP